MPTWGDILIELQQTAVQLQQQQPPRNPGEALDVVRRKYLQQLATHTNRNVIIYATKWTQPGASAAGISINAEDVQGFMEVIHGLTGNTLDLILHSPGGSPEATEALVAYIRSKFDDVRVLIPHAAMSAACMLSCSANRIVMGKHSFLGPVDPQFIIRTELGDIQAVPAHAILEQFEMAQEQCKNTQLLGSWLPMLKQYGPALLVQCELAIKLSKTLVSDWLAQYMFASNTIKIRKAKAVKIAKVLANHGKFKSHGRFISRDQAKSLGLVVDDLESDQLLQDALLSVYHATTHTFNASPAVKLIENHLGKAFIKQEQAIMMQPGGRPQQIGAPPQPGQPLPPRQGGHQVPHQT